ncbi:hypothetical protein GCM10010972_00640 [Cellulomonas carbonis]|nr:hypothetical protein GCM10010972_00640 [Cellulomonas carbonis]
MIWSWNGRYLWTGIGDGRWAVRSAYDAEPVVLTGFWVLMTRPSQVG